MTTTTTATTTKNNNNYDSLILEIDTELSDINQRINKLKNTFFILYEFRQGLDVDKFASSKPGERTPVDCFWSNNKKQQQHRSDIGGCT